MLTSIFARFGSYLLVAAIAAFGGSQIDDYLDKPVKIPPSPDCICPKQEPCAAVNLDKIKTKGPVHFENHQHINVNADSIAFQSLEDNMRKVFQEELSKFKKLR